MLLNDRGRVDFFPFLIVGACVGTVGYLAFCRQWWMLAVMAGLGIVFGLIELACKLITGKSVSQHWWNWRTGIEIDDSSNLKCPSCGHGLKFPNSAESMIFAWVLIVTFVTISIHLIWKP